MGKKHKKKHKKKGFLKKLVQKTVPKVESPPVPVKERPKAELSKTGCPLGFDRSKSQCTVENEDCPVVRDGRFGSCLYFGKLR